MPQHLARSPLLSSPSKKPHAEAAEKQEDQKINEEEAHNSMVLFKITISFWF